VKARAQGSHTGSRAKKPAAGKPDAARGAEEPRGGEGKASDEDDTESDQERETG